jgi:phosphate acetyltransferase
MGFIDSIYDKAKNDRRRVTIPECTNKIMMSAAARAAEAGIADIVLVGDRNKIEAAAQEYGIGLSEVKIVDVGNETYKEQLVERYGELPNKVMGKKSVARRMNDPLYISLVMEAVDDADITFGGLDTTTYEFILAAQSIIGLAGGVTTPSAFILLEIEGFEGDQGNCFGMADGGVCLEPTSEQLASIAVSCCDTFTALMGRDARCAMLSHSTCGSGAGPSVDRIRAAVELANAQRPNLMIDGEFQADAAINQRVAAKKVNRPSDVAGRADVLIFPDVAACNIGSKLIQLLTKSRSYGPIYQGFRLPVLDCSRGDTEERIFDNIALCSVLAARQRGKKGGDEG